MACYDTSGFFLLLLSNASYIEDDAKLVPLSSPCSLLSGPLLH